MKKTWQISELLLLLVLSVPVIFGLAYILWPVSPKLAIAAEFTFFLAMIITWFKVFDNLVSHP
jgi:ABC-type thiamin/hydroxymethylpyrimidine transport system permease subunit